jgi:hypothetical protein
LQQLNVNAGRNLHHVGYRMHCGERGFLSDCDCLYDRL